MSWDKFDADRAAGDKGRPSSADKLAEAVKSSLGDRDAAPRASEHPGRVVSRAVESRPVESRPVKSAYDKAAEHANAASEKATTGDEHRLAASAHRDAARLAPNAKLSAAHERLATTHDKSAEVRDRRGVRSADKLAQQARSSGAGDRAAYDKAAGRARSASEDARTAEDHTEAASAHREAARLAPSDRERGLHEKVASTHEKSAEVRARRGVTRSAVSAEHATPVVKKEPAWVTERKNAEIAKAESKKSASAPTVGRVTRVVRKAPGGGSLERKSTAGTAAERLVADRDVRAQSHYEKVADRAEKASHDANDAAGHAEAYRQHVHAANVAPTEELRTMHMKLAVSHDRATVYEKSTQARAESLNAAKTRVGQPTSPVKAPTVAERTYTGNRDRAAYLSAKASTPSDHRAAAGAHDLAAKSAPTPVLEKMHEGKAVEHLQAAERARPAAASVKLARTATGAVKVTSGSQHLGNIESRGGRYTAVVAAGRGKLSSASFDTHEEALDHIRQSHGLGRMSSAERLAARMQ